MKDCRIEQKSKEKRTGKLEGKQKHETHPRKGKGKEREEGRLGKLGDSLTE